MEGGRKAAVSTTNFMEENIFTYDYMYKSCAWIVFSSVIILLQIHLNSFTTV